MKRKRTAPIQVNEKNTIVNYFTKRPEDVVQATVDVTDKYIKEADSLTNIKTTEIIDKENEFYPNYLTKNFDKIINEITNHRYDASLFSKNEIDIIKSYQNLSIESKKLFLKLYGRQWKWQRFEKDCSSNSSMNFQNLVQNGFISNDLSELNLRDKLKLLLVDEIEKLAKKFNIKSLKKKKNDVIESILSASNHKGIISNFMQLNSAKNSLLSKIEVEINKYLKSTYKILSSVRNTFCKITVLFSIVDNNWDDCSNLGDKNQKLLFFLLQIERNEVLLPSYKLSRVSDIFESGIDVDNYATALEYSLKLRHFLDNNKFDEAHGIYISLSKQFDRNNLLIDETEFDKNLPNFLKRFTLKSLLIRIYSSVVTLLEKRRQYSDAVDLLKTLITATKLSTSSKSRGKWYFRLCVNYQSHLKNQTESIFWLEEALKDKSIPDYFKLTFKNRFDKLKKNRNDLKPDLDFDDSTMDWISEENIQIKSRKSIEAPRQYDIMDNHRPRYIWEDLDGEIHCYVEDYVIYYYINKENYTNGIHGETGTFVLYFLLLFYDIIYADVPDVFYCSRQTVPLDMYSTSFRLNRQQLIDRKFDWLTNQSTSNDIELLLVDNWKAHFNELGLVANWGLIDNEADLIGLFRCLGIDLVLKICEKFLENFSFWCSGMPDLVLWNSLDRTYEIIEVKGPGDKLSDKQKLWMMELQKMNANVSLCLVEGEILLAY